MPFDIEGECLLFQVITDYYEKRSLITTTNIEFGKQRTVFSDGKLAAAAINHLVHHGRLVGLNSDSKRMDKALILEEALFKNMFERSVNFLQSEISS